MTLIPTQTIHRASTVHVLLNDGGSIDSVCVGAGHGFRAHGYQCFSADLRSAPQVKALSK